MQQIDEHDSYCAGPDHRRRSSEAKTLWAAPLEKGTNMVTDAGATGQSSWPVRVGGSAMSRASAQAGGPMVTTPAKPASEKKDTMAHELFGHFFALTTLIRVDFIALGRSGVASTTSWLVRTVNSLTPELRREPTGGSMR
jgi:hypothetical protein